MTTEETPVPDPPPTAPLRVVQWATGNIGTRSLRAVIEHPNLTLAGLYVHSAAKAGRDAGELCGLGPTGVVATDDPDEACAVDADCVLYMPRSGKVDEVSRLLAAGRNVVTTAGMFHHPAGLDAEVRARVEAACEAGGTTVHSTGSSPGFITEAVPIVLTSLQRRLDRLTIDEFANLSQRPSPDLLFNIMGFGHPPSDFSEQRLGHLRNSFGPSLQQLADAVGLSLDSVEARGEVATAPRPIEIAAGTLDSGTVAAQRITVSGLRAGRELLRFRATWYCTPELEPSWELQATGWHVSVEGDTPLEVSIELPIPLERMADVAPGLTAHRAVNAVPAVCAAPAGIRTTAELPQVIARLGGAQP
jgi:4-hydroxy-tetrahydrodipicolinate reductase